ncbi:MAG: ribonuclease J, partial [Pseudomonadota bacterium]
MANSDVAARDGKDNDLVLVPLGGVGEIGMNAYLYGMGPEDDRTWLMVDLGLTFPGSDEPGVDVILPDLTFIKGERKNLAGLVITHAHEDHIGAVLELWPELEVPVYATPFAAGMLRAKSTEFGGRTLPDLHEVALGSRFSVGPFDLELIDMSHSIPETSGIAMRTPHGIVLHTADWKLDDAPYVGRSTDIDKLKALGAEGVTTLVCDSTNVMRDGASASEEAIAASLADVVKAAKRRVVITTFSSNVARIKAAADAAAANGRKFVVAGRALHRVIAVAMDSGYLPEDFTYLDQDAAQRLPASEILLLVTGSQGENRAALARIANDDHPTISLDRGDTVIYSSRTIPGNEREVLGVQNKLAEMGVEIITDADALVHVTGHPRRDELRELYGWVKPDFLVPMHGEPRHLLEHAKFAGQHGIKSVKRVRDGDVVRLAPNPGDLIDEVPVGRLYRDGKLIIAADEGSVRERRKLSMAGIVVVALTVDRHGNVLADPDAILDGIPFETRDGTSFEDLVFDAVDRTVAGLSAKRKRDFDATADSVKRAVRSAIEQAWGKRTIVKVIVTEIDTKA